MEMIGRFWSRLIGRRAVRLRAAPQCQHNRNAGHDAQSVGCLDSKGTSLMDLGVLRHDRPMQSRDQKI